MDKNKFLKIVYCDSLHSVDIYSIAFKELGKKDLIVLNDFKMPSASTIKIFIMVTCYKLKLENSLNFEAIIESMGQANLQCEVSYRGYSVKRLIELMMIYSDNEATNILIQLIGMKRINETIQALGCNKTILNRRMLDYEAALRGLDNFTSAKDLTTILEKLYYGNCISKELDYEMLQLMTKCNNNTKIPAKLPKGTKVAHKTGELNGIENDAGIIYTNKGDYILVVLLENGISSEEIQIIQNFSRKIYDLIIR